MCSRSTRLLLVFTLVMLTAINIFTVYQYADRWRIISNIPLNKSRDRRNGNMITEKFIGTHHINLQPRNPKRFEDECRRKRFLIYYCGNTSICGGLGDRHKGIVAAYLMAMLLKRQFAILSEKPCPLTNFLDKNEYDWRQCNRYLSGPNTTGNVGCIINEYGQSTPLNNLSNSFPSDRIIFLRHYRLCLHEMRHYNDIPKRFQWVINSLQTGIVRDVLKKLFRPKLRLKQALQSFQAQIEDKGRLVCSHVRMSRNPSIPSDYIRHQPNVSVVFQFLNRTMNRKDDILYIASDSDDVKLKSKLFFGDRVLVSHRPIVHVDLFNRSKSEEACEGLFTALYELTVLTTCEVLVLTVGGFGGIAAWMKNSIENLFCYSLAKEAVYPCRLDRKKYYGSLHIPLI